MRRVISQKTIDIFFREHRLYQWINPGPRNMYAFRNKDTFYGKELLAHRPTPKVEDHTLSAVRYCLFNIFAATLDIGGHSSIRNLRKRHAVVKGTRILSIM